ncbi:hypothetical protein BC939DRAFT_508209 [Gamsiella multidivaricata]|uniref:uncharacterized protein n=1 Tax=Gamsiella multidivaricata TaxID=101098 RepID=UPI002220663F|nr:uncharacterized protein BC939DRAFT_508209 [Gamsiella multidivaricata]KAI7816552.1 hypothetical protein BC939DRAFT_508209 [Gamsiella multidivaricata]
MEKAGKRIDEWARTFSKGNKKPMAPREYPPMRVKKDIVLQDIKPIPDQPSTNPKTVLVAHEQLEDLSLEPTLGGKEKKKDETPMTSRPNRPTETKESTAPKCSPAEIQAANSHKEMGNEYYKKGQWEKAFECYSDSMYLDPHNSVYPINRAMALLKLQRFAEAERDCTLGLKLDSKNLKALWRRGMARRSIGNFREAKEDFEAGLKIEPGNKTLKEELAKLEQMQKKPTTTPPPASKPVPLSTPKAQQTKVVPAPSSAKEKLAIPVISSKRVQIKEIENDESSELFESAAAKTSTTSTTSIQATAPAAPLNPTSSTTSAAGTPVVSKAPSSSALTSPQATSSNVNMSTPATTLDFQRDWKSYSKNSGLLYQYIKLIQPGILPTLFKSSFESDYLASMLFIFREYYIPSEEPQLLYRTLVNLAKVQRFDMTLMFMSGTDKKGHLNDQAVYNQQDLVTLASKFKTTDY